jgi:hypothetical protein
MALVTCPGAGFAHAHCEEVIGALRSAGYTLAFS